ncbi:YiiX/YebB-like N1pC/P60 family cysteine hydrolase [Akkermansiaceae bacterium]|nr:YiiX/YebB-like N1pC/P60 family cysteine hydrolase [Akkermansiaceae bacterium]
MKLKIWIVFLSSVLSTQGFWLFKQARHPHYENLKTGDVVFQDTGGEQGTAVRAATKSNYTHCGVVFKSDGKLYVFEAIQPVSVIPLNAWKARSSVFHARRLKNGALLTQRNIEKATQWGLSQLDKNYDALFQWGDDELYCSELVWKVYHEATGLKLCEPRPFSAYFLDDPAVLKIVRSRYGELEELPKNEPVVAPSDLAKSPLLEEVPHRSTKR